MPPRGYKSSEETRQKLRDSAKAQWADPVKRKVLQDALRDPEVESRRRQSLSAVQKGKKLSPEHKEKLRAASLALWQQAEHRAKVAAGLQRPDVRERMYSPERNENVRKARIRYWAAMSPAERLARSATWRLAGHATQRGWSHGLSRDAINKAAAITRAKWAAMSPAERSAATLRPRQAMLDRTGPTSIEIAVARELDRLAIVYEPQKAIGPWIVDFYLPAVNAVIECDGDYWHSLPLSKLRDQRKNGWLAKHHYPFVRLWETQIKTNPTICVETALMQLGVLSHAE